MWRSVSSLLALLLFMGGCASVDPVIKVGLVGPFEGEHRTIGYDAIYSARLAVREVNEAGGIGGYRVALLAIDDSGDPELARQTARSMVIDPGVIAVVGHWLPETTAVAAPIYAQADLPLLAQGELPFVASDPAQYPAEFQEAYEDVTPFEETAGPYAGPTYDAFQLLWQAFERGLESDGQLDRVAVAKGLVGLEYEGMTGTVYVPVAGNQ